MNTTDKDIQVLEEMREKCERCIEIGCPICSAQLPALSNILSDFRDMRELLEAASFIRLNDSPDADGLIRDWDCDPELWLIRLPGHDPHIHYDSVLDAWREVKEKQ